MEERIDILARRARRLRARGEFRKAANAYGELTSLEPEAGRWWVLLGVMLHAAHRLEPAHKALRQAVYYFHQRGEPGREQTVRLLLDRLADGDGSPHPHGADAA
jgi:Flp pilus assembly protein TadD